MKFTQVLLSQHIGRYFKEFWRRQGRRVPMESGAQEILIKKGIPIYQPSDILKELGEFEKVEVVGAEPKPVVFDETHPNWHSRICYSFRDDNVLLEGLNQAKIITKSIETQNGLPDRVALKELPKGLNRKVKQLIFSAHIYDAEQQKLPKIKDPLRPAWNFPRTYGITDSRINKLMVSKLIQLMEAISTPEIVKQRTIFNDLYFSYPFEKKGDLIQFQLRGDTLLTASKPLQAFTSEDTSSMELPNIFPIRDIITLNPENIYEIKDLYSVDTNIPKHHPHTVFVHYNMTEVKNLYEEEVTDSQVLGRSLLKCFTVAASYARQQYGDNVKLLPDPVTLQCVHTDGRLFHFGILQLNTLDLEGSNGMKNIWYQTSRIPLFESCSYVLGKPTLLGYNSEVIQHLLAFYHNI